MFDEFRKYLPSISDEKWKEYIGYYHRLEVPARKILLKEGEIPTKAFMVESGCLRVWFNKNGKDITFRFVFEKEAVSSAESFQKSLPSLFTIESIEPSVIHWIDKNNLDKILSETIRDPSIRDNFIYALRERQFFYMKLFLSFIRDNPAERYLTLMKDDPRILQRVPQRYIASYLGITPVSLSRIRKKLK